MLQRRNWSDELIAKNMVAVFIEYTVDYDNTKVPHISGTHYKYAWLIREDEESPWFIYSWGH
jgi:hypothetical protein